MTNCKSCNKGFITEQENEYDGHFSRDGTKGIRYYKYCSNSLCNFTSERLERKFF